MSTVEDDDAEYCLTCRYWEDYHSAGECHRHAPISYSDRKERDGLAKLMDTGELKPNACWPLTLAYDWCGDWKGCDTPAVKTDEQA